LPRNQPSGLLQAARILKNTEGIEFVYLDSRDVIRHRLVKKLIELYDQVNNKDERTDKNQL
ncbi:MAG TPA: PhoH family protein, partial [Bacteroidia bacterium]|nr:PhoH family protein [Bacteroidia bacterium]